MSQSASPYAVPPAEGWLPPPPMPTKGYFRPLVLSNGIDFCQLDFSGAMTFKTHINGQLSYWYKKGRPFAHDPLGLVKLEYYFISDKGPVEFGEFKQRFDPLTGVLQSEVAGYQIRLALTTFLAPGHTMVETFTVLEVEPVGTQLLFENAFPALGYGGLRAMAFSAYPGRLTIDEQAQELIFNYHWDHQGQQFQGRGISTIQVLKGAAKLTRRSQEHLDKFELAWRNLEGRLAPLAAGDVYRRVTTVYDSMDGADWSAQMDAEHRRYLALTPEAMAEVATAPWREFSGQSRFSCVEPELTRQAATSLYVAKASTAPNGSSVTTMSHPNGHSMGTYWDVWYGFCGMVRFNRLAEARQILSFYESALAHARENAAGHYQSRGARFSWVMLLNGRELSHANQIHNNIIPVYTAWDYYAHTGDRETLAALFPVMHDALLFLVDYALKREADGTPYLRELMAPDESHQPKRNEIVTLTGIRRGLEMVMTAAQVLGREVDPALVAALPAVEAIMATLWAPDGRLLPYLHGTVGTWATPLYFLQYPDAKRFGPAIEHALEGCRESHGLNIGRTSRMRCVTFPWNEGIFAWAMARNGDARAWDLLRGMNNFTSWHGGIPEYIWAHGETSRDWYVGAHGVYLAALAELLVQRVGDEVRLFPAGDGGLVTPQLAVERLRLPGGLLVSLQGRPVGGLQITVANDTATAQTVAVAWQRQRQTINLGAHGTARVELPAPAGGR